MRSHANRQHRISAEEGVCAQPRDYSSWSVCVGLNACTERESIFGPATGRVYRDDFHATAWSGWFLPSRLNDAPRSAPRRPPQANCCQTSRVSGGEVAAVAKTLVTAVGRPAGGWLWRKLRPDTSEVGLNAAADRLAADVARIERGRLDELQVPYGLGVDRRSG